MHVDLRTKEILYYDSMGGPGTKWLELAYAYIYKVNGTNIILMKDPLTATTNGVCVCLHLDNQYHNNSMVMIVVC